MNRPLVTIVLAGGKGTRMGSRNKHKVCFEVLGVPVILRALETYNLCGSRLNVVVVGSLARQVMATVNRRFPGTVYAYQDTPRGTGDAARLGAEILERTGFDGDVLLVAGDKVIEPRILQQLLSVHRRTAADVTLASATRPLNSSTGILLQSDQGHIVGILEEADRQQLLGWSALSDAFRRAPRLTCEVASELLARHCSDKTARRLIDRLWQGREASAPLARSDFERAAPGHTRRGLLQVGTLTVPAGEILERFDQMNLSTYLFRAPVLYEALHRLRPAPGSQEEYLTDVFALLANRKQPARVVGCRIEDPDDLMAFNNPRELQAIEEVYRRRHGQSSIEVGPRTGGPLPSVGEWENLLQHPSAAARRQFRQWYGEEVPWPTFRRVLQAFAGRYGANREVAIIRSPGRINLLGRHIDHQGGSVNVMAVNREVFLAASPRADDQVSLANTDPGTFPGQTFRISDLVATLNWDDWQHVVDGPRLQRLLDDARGDWTNYAKAGVLRLQEQFRDRRLRGLDLMACGEIPMGAGLSSSSALVVATAEAVTEFNQLPVSARRLVSLCGEGEWFVGTRGGAADHAAIKLARRGFVTRVGFFPFRIEASAPFLPDHELIVCNSGIYAGKSNKVRSLFNEKVTAYHIGRVWFTLLRAELAPRIQHLRDLQPAHLGLSPAAFLELLDQLPCRLPRAKVQAAFSRMSQEQRAQLERLFATHDAPAQGYAVKDVVLFGLSEMARARRCLDLLERRASGELGRLMAISHDGDRVARETKSGHWRPIRRRMTDALLSERPGQPHGGDDLALLSGGYGCSLPALDRMVDLALRLPGVEGAQMAGAGLGGCIMVLVQKAH
ncbi:MAG: NTP transferase domain-containing protein, partial [Verrucomicrobiae bacterium]|nr:NTP transferase domain-containing protein [Verrucomicrobiae bacterium]